MQKHSKRIFVSNRLPFTVNPKNQSLTRGSGGLVSALLGVSLDEPFSWMGFETDPKTAEILRERSGEIKNTLSCHPVMLSKEVYDRYYDGTANDLIWPLFHYENHLALFDRENWNLYREANQTMADEILKVANNEDTIWIHDFHFLLLPEMLKNKNPKLKVGFFLHIPFPCVEIFRQLPVREEVLKSLTTCDLIGFHEYSYLRNFVMSMKAFLGVDATLLKAEIGNHTLNLGVYPISIDTEDFQKKASSEKVKNLCKTYRESNPGMFKIVGIDRLDYTKGLALKLRGFQQALKKYPQLVGKISLIQVAVPSRQKVPFYAQIKKELDQLVGAINGEFGAPDYVPVQYIFKSIPEETLLALYRRADAALITSKRDGMNLVAMEYVMAQDIETPGVLILSEFAGAASLLPDAVIINPWDADIIADSIFQATTMAHTEKYQRLYNLQQTLLKYSASKWAEGFLNDLESTPAEDISCLPLSPSAAHWPNKLSRSLQNRKIRLVLDYDGTLAPLRSRPELATLDPQVRDLILRLNEDVEVFILSGRPREFLNSQFGDLPISLVAEHGAFYRWAGQKWQSRVSSDVSSWYAEVSQVMSSYSDKVPFSFVEKKEAGIVWHYRQSPPDFAEFQAKKLDDELKTCLGNEPVAVMMGSKIVEAKATECNKGSFLRWLMLSSFKDTAYYICIGDDRTDEDMFKILGEKGISIKVGPEHTAANYRILEQKNVPAFLSEMQAYINGQSDQLRSTHV
jgi:trehalose 6-phosphate synthase/phosphatase